MKLAYPAFSDVINIGGQKIPTIVIENKKLFRTIVCDFHNALQGIATELVLSKNERVVDVSKNAELLIDFIDFDINKRSLLNKILVELEKTAVSPEHYVKTQELLAEIERMSDDWAFSYPCDIVSSGLSISNLLKALSIRIRSDYEGHVGEVEKVLDYMELVREFDRDKLFVTINMRSFFDDDIVVEFLKTAISHEFKVLMLESQAYTQLEFENRLTVDADLCEF